ncbi:substrate-binding periplasmic protein [Alteromonas halophila]|uniref:Solute-binding protein family 3/N-terminal domain-containing protein n=1 Tax=Alteromonas halophila TaxID=516698 RepID=A0A918JJ01_9ALTE|nr:hypothetical protein [Alteromonas halophila]GGW82633.1 hypothetical protein GCM10007391_14660 [Alteromonas halophila]
MRKSWLLGFLLIAQVSSVQAESLTLAASPFTTYVDDEGEPARLSQIIREAFSRMDQDLQLNVMRQAFLGSSLLSGRADGEFAYLDLGDRKSNFVYSKPYLPAYLYAASKAQSVQRVKLIPHLHDYRVAIENRFANTPRFRLIKDIKWSRNPSSFDVFRQIADDRAPYLITTRLLIDEFNRLLSRDGEELLLLSAAPLVSTGLHLSLNKKHADAQTVITRFDETIATMQRDGSFNRLLGIAWLTRDVDGDGVADYISSSDVAHEVKDADALNYTYPLDATQTGDASSFYVDGKKYDDWQDVAPLIADSGSIRPSLLDPEVYARMIQRW